MIPPLSVSDERIPRVLLARRAKLTDRNWPVSYRHQGGHALHLHGYRGRWRCAQHQMDLNSGVATLSPRDTDTAYDLDQEGWHWVVHFASEDGDLQVPLWCDLGPDAAYARSRMALITAQHDLARTVPGAAVAAGAAVLELLAWLAGRNVRPGRRHRADAAVDRVAALLREQPDRDWRTPVLAKRVGLSPNWLSTRFRARFGMTIDRFRLTQRVEMARLLLGSTTLPIHVIGARVGLPDPQHFNKVFRSIVGLAPSACRPDPPQRDARGDPG